MSKTITAAILRLQTDLRCTGLLAQPWGLWRHHRLTLLPLADGAQRRTRSLA